MGLFEFLAKLMRKSVAPYQRDTAYDPDRYDTHIENSAPPVERVMSDEEAKDTTFDTSDEDGDKE